MPELIIRKPGQGAARVSQRSREERWNDDDEVMKQWRAGTKALTVSDGTDAVMQTEDMSILIICVSSRSLFTKRPFVFQEAVRSG